MLPSSPPTLSVSHTNTVVLGGHWCFHPHIPSEGAGEIVRSWLREVGTDRGGGAHNKVKGSVQTNEEKGGRVWWTDGALEIKHLETDEKHWCGGKWRQGVTAGRGRDVCRWSAQQFGRWEVMMICEIFVCVLPHIKLCDITESRDSACARLLLHINESNKWHESRTLVPFVKGALEGCLS